jgi:hypothetical protein
MTAAPRAGIAWRIPRSVIGVLGAALALRLVLAYVVYPGQGLVGDLDLFTSWATTLARVGPGGFYTAAGSANYPPGYMYVLWLVGIAGNAISGVHGVSADQAVGQLLKLPAIGADIAIGGLLWWAGRRWFGGRAGLLAAALYLFIPVTWYDSALWGQVDAVGALVMLAALILLVEGWSEPAAALAALGVLVKPQDAICLVIVIPVLVRRHLLRPGSGPVPGRGPRAALLDRRLGGILTAQGPIRLATSALVALVVLIVPLLPFDIGALGPASLADVPVIGHLAGLVGLFVADGGQYSVLTANAYNAWALVGGASLASVVGGSGGAWIPDSLQVAGGLSAVTVGALLLALTGLLVAGGLLLRCDRLAILLGLSVVAFAFYALPTRVHERYLVPFFAPAALLAAGSMRAGLGYLGLGALNAVNLHAVLAAPLRIASGGLGGGGGGAFGGPGGTDAFSAAGGGAAFSGAGRGAGTLIDGFGGAAGGGFGGRSGSASISLPFADLARGELAVTLVAVGQTAGFVALLAAWIVVILRPNMEPGARALRRAAIGVTSLRRPKHTTEVPCPPEARPS